MPQPPHCTHLHSRHTQQCEGPHAAAAAAAPAKVIEYKLSELRAIELLDDLCEDAAAAHSLVPLAGDAGDAAGEAEEAEEGARAWVRVKGGDSVIDRLGVRCAGGGLS
jgi:hypothetical protein